MRTILLYPLLLLIACTTNESAPAAESDHAPSVAQVDTLDDESGLRVARERLRQLGVPTPARVDSMRQIAYQLYENNNCSEAIDSLQRFARTANWLANLISKGLDPYYSGSFRDRERVTAARLRQLIPYENRANLYKDERNEAYVMIAECSLRLGDSEQAVAYYFNALELVSPTDDDLWERARLGLYDLIEVE